MPTNTDQCRHEKLTPKRYDCEYDETPYVRFRCDKCWKDTFPPSMWIRQRAEEILSGLGDTRLPTESALDLAILEYLDMSHL